jgi:outer membrane protein assembly factor BamB
LIRSGKTPNPVLIVLVIVAFVCLSATGCSGAGTLPAKTSQGGVTHSWSSSVSDKDLLQGLSLNADHGLLVETTVPATGQDGAQVSALRAGDGGQAWQTSLGSAAPTAVFSDGDYVAVSTTPTQLTGSSQAPFYVFDARTGGLLRTGLVNIDSDLLGFADGNLIFTEEDTNLTFAMSPATGMTVWDWTAPCQINNSYANPHVAADSQLVGVVCSRAQAGNLYALNPANGRPIWHSIVSPPNGPGGPLTISGSLISYVSQGTVTLFSPTGDKLDTEPTDSSVSNAWVGQNGQQAQFAYLAPDQSIQVKIIDVGTGKVSKNFALRGYVNISAGPYPYSLSFSADTAVIVLGFDTTILSGAVLQVNLVDGSRSLSPLPYLPRFIGEFPIFLEQSSLYLITSYTGLNAYRLTAPAGQSSGRVAIMQDAVRHWPNPCSLVPSSTLTSLIGAGYRTVRTPILGYGGFPQASKCLFAAKLPRQISVYVNVMWDADSSAQAAAIFTTELGDGSTVPGPWDNSRYDNYNDFVLPDNTMFRVGHLIMQVYDTDATHISQRLAAAITERIRRTGAGAGS